MIIFARFFINSVRKQNNHTCRPICTVANEGNRLSFPWQYKHNKHPLNDGKLEKNISFPVSYFLHLLATSVKSYFFCLKSVFFIHNGIVKRTCKFLLNECNTAVEIRQSPWFSVWDRYCEIFLEGSKNFVFMFFIAFPPNPPKNIVVERSF